MEFFYFLNRQELDDFITGAAATGGAEFLQSWEWGDILQADKQDVIRVGIKRDGEVAAAAAMVVSSLPAGQQYLYAPRGPIFKAGLADDIRLELENYLFLEVSRRFPRAVFFRAEPQAAISESIFRVKRSVPLQPRQTLITDLVLSEDELLKSMRQKTRYNINLALKKDVEIREGDVDDFPEFWRLLALTGTRDDFRLHGAEHYRHLLSGAPGFIRLYKAVYQDKNIAAGLFCFWGDKVTYLHGASDNEFRNVMAPYLLQWSVIKAARAAGYKYYDFYGIDEKKWPGVTRFKVGFGGRTVTYPGTYDIIFKPVFYGAYSLMRRLRRLLK